MQTLPPPDRRVREIREKIAAIVGGGGYWANQCDELLAAALAAERAEATRRERERCAKWHDDEAAICASKNYDNDAEFHRDCASYFRALADQPQPAEESCQAKC